MACKGTVPSFAVSIGAAVRRRFRRLFRLNRSTPCGPQAAPDGRPVVPLPSMEASELRQSRRSACIAVKEKPAARCDSRFPIAEDMFFHSPAKNTPRPASSTAAREAERFSFQISSETAARNSAAPGKRLSEERGKSARAHAFYSARQFRKCFRPAYCVSTICTVGSSIRISSTAPFSLRPSTTARAFSCRA